MLHKLLNFFLLIFFLSIGFWPCLIDLYEKRKKRKLEEQKAIEEELKRQEAEKIAKQRAIEEELRNQEKQRIAEQRALKKEEKLNQLKKCYIEHIFKPTLNHLDTLLLKRRNGTYYGDYDELVDDEWQQDLTYFVEHVIETNAYTVAGKYMCYPYTDEIFNDIVPNCNTTFNVSDFIKIDYDIKIAMNKNSNYDPETYVKDMVDWIVMLFSLLKPDTENTTTIDTNNPFDYEKQIANILKDMGFNAYATKGSGDQGADVLATKNNVKFAIQCKMYSGPVGNKAVQEVNAARNFYNCDYAVVVTNATYTKSAHIAAKACNVILLHESQLDKLLDYITE